MKSRLTITVLMAIIIVAGCAAVQVQIDPVLIGKILARRVGYELAIAAPEQAADLIPYAQEVMDAEDVAVAAEAMAIKLIEIQLPGQPLLAEDVKDLSSIFRFEMDWSDSYIESVRLIAEEVIKGIVYGQGV